MIRIDPSALDTMITDAELVFPDECCGFLFGTEKDGDRFVNRAMAVINAKEGDKRRRFEITAKDYMEAERFAEENAIELIGIYHSHPNHPAVPSEHDRLAAQPFFSYLILSVMEGSFDDIRSWQLNADSRFEEETVDQIIISKTTINNGNSNYPDSAKEVHQQHGQASNQ